MIDKNLARFSIALLAAAGLIACACDLALIWDGGAQFCFTLYHGEPYAYSARFFSTILWEPVMWAAHFTRDLAVLRFIFALPLCLAPAINAALSWWMVARTRPALFPWALLGICAASLPAQVFVANESIFQLNVFWPVFLGLLIPLDRARQIVLACLLVFQFSHPQGLLLLTAGALALALLAKRSRAILLAVAAMLCLARIVLFPDVEAAHQADPKAVVMLFWQGLVGWPLLGWLCLLGAIWSLRKTSRFGWECAAWLAVSAAAWWWWAAVPEHWAKALDARRFVPLLAAPFFFGAWHSMKTNEPSAALMRAAAVAALIFAVTFSAQAFEWKSLMRRLSAELAADPRTAFAAEEFAWLRGSPAEHWGIGAQAIALFGGKKLILDAAGRAAIRRDPPLIALGFEAWVAPDPGVLGWFDCREAVQRARAE